MPLSAQVAFVPTTSGTLVAPCALHDPRNAELVALLEAGSAFPAGAFANDAQVQSPKGITPGTVQQAVFGFDSDGHPKLPTCHAQTWLSGKRFCP